MDDDRGGDDERPERTQCFAPPGHPVVKRKGGGVDIREGLVDVGRQMSTRERAMASFTSAMVAGLRAPGLGRGGSFCGRRRFSWGRIPVNERRA